MYLRHVATNSRLPSRQSAYHPFHSVKTTLVSVHNDLVRATDSVLVTVLDLSSAFDTVKHLILLYVLIHRHAVCACSTICNKYLTLVLLVLEYYNQVISY